MKPEEQQTLDIPPDAKELMTKLEAMTAENEKLKATAEQVKGLQTQLTDMAKQNADYTKIVNEIKTEKETKENEELKAKKDFEALFEKMQTSQKALTDQLNEKDKTLYTTAAALKAEQDKLAAIETERAAKVTKLKADIKAVADKKGDTVTALIAEKINDSEALELLYGNLTKSNNIVIDKSRKQIDPPPEGLMTVDDYSVQALLELKTGNPELYKQHLESIGKSGVLNTNRAVLR